MKYSCVQQSLNEPQRGTTAPSHLQINIQQNKSAGFGEAVGARAPSLGVGSEGSGLKKVKSAGSN